MDLDLNKITQRIDLVRREKGLTQEQFAAELGISQPAVSYYLKERIPPAEIMLKIANLGNTTIEWILTGQKNYLKHKKADAVNEPGDSYDAELLLVRKIAGLPAELRSALNVLIDYMESHLGK
ncbi:MAG: helix-turn-helix transcriptional regulator [Calditrichaceae bacterium]|nr:helix-turn-helix transcriptional regulator [Calditrichaceae bacterium]MBN2709230.1 helix-turn-helix transcriptional regulator [Calditrichaceae bacterium]RQV96183.1 MAG: XRE family transcriptional regulator [Calditrichota bacterium]